MKARLPATLLLAGACSALPLAHADEVVNLPTTQVSGSVTSDEDDGITKEYQGKPATSTTKLGLKKKELPQAITTITRKQMDDFKINGIKDALRSAPSVTVEQSETDRTEFTSRGFDISSFEYDGMTMPFSQFTLIGDIDMAEYEQIDVLHGANGLMSGTGNPSASVNFIRKRPTETFQARIDSSVGSWDSRRIDVDVSGPLTESGNVRGRFIYAHDKGNSWMDRYSHEKNVAAGLLAFDLSDRDTLTVGFSQHNSDSNGSTWGNLPLVDDSGNLLHYSSRSANVGQDWTYWNMHTQRAFAELQHAFDNGWSATLTVTGIHEYQDTNMFYVAGLNGDEALVFAADTSAKANQAIGEAKLSGPFALFGREHELTLGATYGRTHQTAREWDEAADGYYYTSFAGILAGTTPTPTFGYTKDGNTQDFEDTQKSVYAGARFSLADDLHWIAGARMLSADGSGTSYGSDHSMHEHGKVTPYTGLVYDLTKQWALYASWTKIFNPQYAVYGDDDRLLDPLEGKSLEVGMKGSLMDNKLDLTAAVFKTEQSNVASNGHYVGSQYRYDSADYKSRGIELEASGEAYPGLDVLAGYTYVHIEDAEGGQGRKYVPVHSFHGLMSYRLPMLPKARVGTRLSWQSKIENDSNSAIHQNAYALVDLFTSYEIDQHWSTALNFNNVTDRKYLRSLYSQTQSSYGAPRNLTASVTWKY
ncbi:TonB-dependent siderophore receptor [Pseudomonas massiliensis]|uniref:TonB-dependent siderophore receptor n=1 Tax=Pseudomonas massiliensis TaxID=522492 RepID=UPI000AE7F83D|nr:TonB-dependent siderophore receptor [Pseudomonas massiliensis]